MRFFLEIVGGGAPWLRFLVSLVVVAGVVSLIVWGATALFRDPGSARRDPVAPDPQQILKVRLARGEIDTEEYERLRGYLTSDH